MNRYLEVTPFTRPFQILNLDLGPHYELGGMREVLRGCEPAPVRHDREPTFAQLCLFAAVLPTTAVAHTTQTQRFGGPV